MEDLGSQERENGQVFGQQGVRRFGGFLGIVPRDPVLPSQVRYDWTVSPSSPEVRYDWIVREVV